MAEEYHTFTFPVLLVPPPGSGEKYRPLLTTEYEYAPPERAKVSSLEDTALDAVRHDAHRLKIASDSTMLVEIWEVRRVLLHLSYLVHPAFPAVNRTPSTHHGYPG